MRYVKQDEDGKEVTKILHQYTAEKLSSFGELALMYVATADYVSLSSLFHLYMDDKIALLFFSLFGIKELC